MKKLYIFLFFILVSSLCLCTQSVHSYGDGNVNYITESDINKFNSIKDEEILIILDFSSSMIKKLDGKSRATHAVYAILNVLDTLPSSAKIGLRVFGPDEQSLHEYPNGINSRGDCTASKLAVPVSSNNINSIKNKLSEYTRPFGETPIAYSLKQALDNDFNSSDSLKHIVLITDGGEGCGGNPCGYINNLIRQRKDIKIDVIAIAGEENNSFMGLSCLSNSTNGQFVVVNNSNDLYLKMKTTIVLLPKVNNENPQTINQPKISANRLLQDIPFVNKPNQNIKYKNYLIEFNN